MRRSELGCFPRSISFGLLGGEGDVDFAPAIGTDIDGAAELAGEGVDQGQSQG